MKKNFVKKLALGLALVMAVTSVPASSEAAAAPGFKSSAVKVRVGQTKKYGTENSKKYSVKFKIGNKSVATIKYTAGSKSVKVTGVAEGKTTLRADFKSYKTKETTTVRIPVTVKVAQKIVEFKAVTPKKLNVKFAEALTSTIAKDSVTLVDANGTKVPVQAVTLSDDKANVAVELYAGLTSGVTYTVTVADGSKSYTADLAFVQGEVARIVAANQVVKAEEPQPIVYTVYDVNGLDITDSTVVTFESNVAITDGTVNLSNGVLAYVTVVYTNPTTGAQIKSETFTVTGVDAMASSILGVTLAEDVVPAWPTKVNTTTYLNPNGLACVLSVYYVDQYGNKKIADAEYPASFVSLDPSVLVVDINTGAVTTVATGTAQVKVTIGTVSQIFTITVVNAPKATSLVLDTKESVLKASLTNKTVNTARVTLNVLDQYKEEFNADTDSDELTFTLTSGAGVVEEAATVGAVVAGTHTAGTPVTFTAAKAGTAVFKVTSENTSLNYVMVSIRVYAEDNVVVKYTLAGVKNLDREHAYDGKDETVDYTADIALVPVNKDGFIVSDEDNHVVSEALTGAAIKVTTPYNTTLTPDGTEFTVDSTTDEYRTVGTYKVVAVTNGTTVATASFTVSDTGVAPALTTKKVTVAGSLGVDNFTVPDGWTVDGFKFISGNAAVCESATDTEVQTVTNNSTSNVTLYNVKVVVSNDATDRIFEIAIGSSIVVTP